MKPTIGRVVIYKTTEAERATMKAAPYFGQYCNIQDELPATVVAVWSDTCLNLRVKLDGSGPDVWRASVNQGNEEGQWNWPVIEK